MSFGKLVSEVSWAATKLVRGGRSSALWSKASGAAVEARGGEGAEWSRGVGGVGWWTLKALLRILVFILRKIGSHGMVFSVT